MLYLPRGYWHAAVGMGGPTLHLTVGLTRKNGHDLLAWLADQALAADIVRHDLPLEGDDETLGRHVAALLSAALGHDRSHRPGARLSPTCRGATQPPTAAVLPADRRGVSALRFQHPYPTLERRGAPEGRRTIRARSSSAIAAWNIPWPPLFALPSPPWPAARLSPLATCCRCPIRRRPTRRPPSLRKCFRVACSSWRRRDGPRLLFPSLPGP